MLYIAYYSKLYQTSLKSTITQRMPKSRLPDKKSRLPDKKNSYRFCNVISQFGLRFIATSDKDFHTGTSCRT